MTPHVTKSRIPADAKTRKPPGKWRPCLKKTTENKEERP